LLRIQWGKKIYDPLLILYICPLTKKWSVYHFNGRFIWRVRGEIRTKKIQKHAFQKSYKLIFILMSQISIWSPINLQDVWLPGVFYTGKELRSLKGSAPNLSLLPVEKTSVHRSNQPLWPQELHPHHQTWRWKHYALGVFFC